LVGAAWALGKVVLSTGQAFRKHREDHEFTTAGPRQAAWQLLHASRWQQMLDGTREQFIQGILSAFDA